MLIVNQQYNQNTILTLPNPSYQCLISIPVLKKRKFQLIKELMVLDNEMSKHTIEWCFKITIEQSYLRNRII